MDFKSDYDLNNLEEVGKMLNKYFGYTISNSIAVEYPNNIFIFFQKWKSG